MKKGNINEFIHFRNPHFKLHHLLLPLFIRVFLLLLLKIPERSYSIGLIYIQIRTPPEHFGILIIPNRTKLRSHAIFSIQKCICFFKIIKKDSHLHDSTVTIMFHQRYKTVPFKHSREFLNHTCFIVYIFKNIMANDYIKTVTSKINKLYSGRDIKVEKADALIQCKELEDEAKAIMLQIKVEIDNILSSAYKDTIYKIVEEYKKSLSKLKFEVNTEALTFSPAELVSASLADLSTIISDNTEHVDEGHNETKEIFVSSTRKWYNPFSWFDKGDHTEKYEVWVSRYVDYVDMNEVASDYLQPIENDLIKIQNKAIEHVKSETQRLKEHLKIELVSINKILDAKLNNLLIVEADKEAKAEEIAQKENDLIFLENIQQRVNDIINF